ncbi:MAG: hypothetical protein F6K58_22100 [Symploca sp. SIO2E9]|nr:hypothetical protein [Symploca sp. SIO2E9]
MSFVKYLEVTEGRIGYLAIQISDRLDKVQLLGFTNQQLLLLLDGLDQVREDRRGDCVIAINQFLQQYRKTEIEQIQPEWLQTFTQEWVYPIASRILLSLIVGLIAVLHFGTLVTDDLEVQISLVIPSVIAALASCLSSLLSIKCYRNILLLCRGKFMH